MNLYRNSLLDFSSDSNISGNVSGSKYYADGEDCIKRACDVFDAFGWTICAEARASGTLTDSDRSLAARGDTESLPQPSQKTFRRRLIIHKDGRSK